MSQLISIDPKIDLVFKKLFGVEEKLATSCVIVRKLMIIKKYFSRLFVLVSLVSLIGCTAMHTAIKHRNLEVGTKMSQSIFLDPIPESKKNVYVDIKNTSSEQKLQLQEKIECNLTEKGWKIVKKSNEAYVLLQANVLHVGKVKETTLDEILNGGFGSGITGFALGSGIAHAAGANSAGLIGGSLIGGITGIATDAMVKNVIYTIVTDIRLSVRENKDWKRYTNRLVSTAQKVNLSFEKAKPVLVKNMGSSIAGIL